MRKSLALILAVAAITTGCATTYSPAMNTTDLKDIDFSTMGLREGEDCVTFYLGFIGPFGTARISTAARNGRMKRVYITNSSFKNYVLWQNYCILVQGQ